MLNFSFKILLSFGLFFSVHAGANHYTSIKKTNNFSEVYGVFPSEHQIILYSQFLTPQQFANGNSFYMMISNQLGKDPYEMAYVGRASYRTRLPVNKLTASFFLNIQNIQFLLGTEYSVKSISTHPQSFIFQSARDIPFGGSLTAEVQMQVLDTHQADSNLLTLIQGLTGRSSRPQRLVIQDMHNFNQNILFTKMITALHSNPDSTTDIEVLSVSIFYDFPSFGRSYIESSSEQDLRGYAERLFSY